MWRWIHNRTKGMQQEVCVDIIPTVREYYLLYLPFNCFVARTPIIKRGKISALDTIRTKYQCLRYRKVHENKIMQKEDFKYEVS